MRFENHQLISYKLAYQRQLELVQEVLNGGEDTLLICHHPSIVTLGKKSNPEKDLLGWDGEVISIERGGQATYHGPGQVVIYPIINLKKRGQNIAGFLQAMEKSMILLCGDYDLLATGNPDRGQPDLTGVWVQGKKMGSIGVAIKRWVTYHGLAFNIYHDPLAFQGINPCGMDSQQMTYLEELAQQEIQRDLLEQKLTQYLCEQLDYLLPNS